MAPTAIIARTNHAPKISAPKQKNSSEDEQVKRSSNCKKNLDSPSKCKSSKSLPIQNQPPFVINSLLSSTRPCNKRELNEAHARLSVFDNFLFLVDESLPSSDQDLMSSSDYKNSDQDINVTSELGLPIHPFDHDRSESKIHALNSLPSPGSREEQEDAKKILSVFDDFMFLIPVEEEMENGEILMAKDDPSYEQERKQTISVSTKESPAILNNSITSTAIETATLEKELTYIPNLSKSPPTKCADISNPKDLNKTEHSS